MSWDKIDASAVNVWVCVYGYDEPIATLQSRNIAWTLDAASAMPGTVLLVSAPLFEYERQAFYIYENNVYLKNKDN